MASKTLHTLSSHQFRMVGQATVTTGILAGHFFWFKWFLWLAFLCTSFPTFVFNFHSLIVFASLGASAGPSMVPMSSLALKSYQQKRIVKVNIQKKCSVWQDTTTNYLLFLTIRFSSFMFLNSTVLLLFIFFLLSILFLKFSWQNQLSLWFLSGTFSCLWARSSSRQSKKIIKTALLVSSLKGGLFAGMEPL